MSKDFETNSPRGKATNCCVRADFNRSKIRLSDPTQNWIEKKARFHVVTGFSRKVKKGLTYMENSKASSKTDITPEIATTICY